MATPIEAGQLLFVDNSPEMDTAATWVAQRDGAIIITENPFDDTVDAIFIRNDHRMPFRSSYFKRALQLLDPDVYMYEEEEGETAFPLFGSTLQGMLDRNVATVNNIERYLRAHVPGINLRRKRRFRVPSIDTEYNIVRGIVLLVTRNRDASSPDAKSRRRKK
jgi:hypothetical protein